MEVGIEQTPVYDPRTENHKIIDDYIQARKTEANLAISTQKVMIDNLDRFSRNLMTCC